MQSHTVHYIDTRSKTIMEFVSLIMSTMEQLLEQVFDLANNEVLRDWGVKTVENIADKTKDDMPPI